MQIVITDINECNQGNGGCEHTCNNTIGSYYCTCNTGYQLSKGKHCSGNNNLALICYIIIIFKI